MCEARDTPLPGWRRVREGRYRRTPAPNLTAAPAGLPPHSRLRDALDSRADWVEALIVLTTVAAAFVVLGFLASYFKDYFHLILIFFLAWLLAFLISPVADWLQRRLTRLPRPVAVVAVIVPVILIGGVVVIWIVTSTPPRHRRRPIHRPESPASSRPLITPVWYQLRDAQYV